MQRDGIFARWRAGAKRLDRRMGPDFLYIGCQKAGSSWLYDQLSAHSDFWMPPGKEIHYFDGYEGGAGIASLARRATGKHKRRSWPLSPRSNDAAAFVAQVAAGDGGKLDLDWYASLFRWKGERLSGDITPAYCTLSARMIGLINSRFPDLRYILLVRDPVARAWSHACEMQRHAGCPVPKDWTEMVRFLTSRNVDARSYPSRIFARWSEHVAPDRIFVGFFDRLVSEPDALRADVLGFLGVRSSPPIAPGFDRKRDQARIPCSPGMTRRLAGWFADELQACAQTFGGPATDWPARYGLASVRA